MAQPAGALTMEEAHRKILTKINKINRFLQQCMTVGSFRSEQWAEADDLQRTLAHRLPTLKILWYAEPDEVRFEDMSDWFTVIEDEVRTKPQGCGGLRTSQGDEAPD